MIKASKITEERKKYKYHNGSKNLKPISHCHCVIYIFSTKGCKSIIY